MDISMDNVASPRVKGYQTWSWPFTSI